MYPLVSLPPDDLKYGNRHSCTQNDSQELATATGLLHDWGQLLHFSGFDALQDHIIATPTWLGNVMAQVVTDEARKKQVLVGGQAKTSQISQLLSKVVSSDVAADLILLMERFNILVRISRTRDDVIVPAMLPPEPPAAAWEQLQRLREGGAAPLPQLHARAELRLRLSHVPDALVVRLLCRLMAHDGGLMHAWLLLGALCKNKIVIVPGCFKWLVAVRTAECGLLGFLPSPELSTSTVPATD